MLLLGALTVGGVFLIVHTYYPSQLKEERELQSNKVLEQIAVWFITQGLPSYYQGKDIQEIVRKVNSLGAHLYTDPLIEKHGYIAQLVPTYYWLKSEITCYSRARSRNSQDIYEYWVIHRYSGTRGDVNSEIFFLISQATTIRGHREIIYRTSHFFPDFKAPDGTFIEFPRDNKSAYRLKPWYFPEAFKGTAFEGVKIEIENGRYIRKHIDDRETNWLPIPTRDITSTAIP